MLGFICICEYVYVLVKLFARLSVISGRTANFGERVIILMIGHIGMIECSPFM